MLSFSFQNNGRQFFVLILFLYRLITRFTFSLTVGFETNLEANAEHKRAKYHSLMETPKSKYTDAKFVNLSISSLGILGLSCSSY